MNQEKLKEMSKKNETAKRIIQIMAERRRNTVYTAFSGLRADLKKKDGKEVDREDFDATFAELEKLGVGQVERSERGVFKGFTWSTPVRKIADFVNKEELGITSKVLKIEPQKETPSRRKVTLVVIRRNSQIETIETDERHLRVLSK